jgi:alpha-glucosidase
VSPDRTPWWRDAVVYQVYVRSFADSDGDGIGDLPGITARLDHLTALGVDAVWITPFYTSPQHDHGYDVADHRDVDPLFGKLTDADALLARAHELGLRVIFDLVPNHTSSEHRWFQAALAAEPGSPERDRYLFRTGRAGGSEPPNNWSSIFGGPAWTRVGGTDQWYLHLFDATQPDLNWRNPEVGDEFADVLRFWLDRGVDGFRIDVAHGLFKEASLRDKVDPEPVAESSSMVDRPVQDEPMFDQPEVHEVYRRWRTILDSYPGERMAVAEAWTQTPEAMARYIRPDELQQSFNFAWLSAEWSAEAFTEVISSTLAAVGSVGASPTWVLSNHDVVRHPTRYDGGPRGIARGLAATATMLALPGSCYLYQGEELGLEQVDVPEAARQDPSWFRMGVGRDGCRVPLPWGGHTPPYGFGPGDSQPWLPQPHDWSEVAVAEQEADATSVLQHYRRLLATRRALLRDGGGDLGEELELLDLGADVVAYRRGPLTVVLNCGEAPVPLPPGDVVHASGELAADRSLPPDTAVWLR